MTRTHGAPTQSAAQPSSTVPLKARPAVWIRRPWASLLGILGFELWLVYSIPSRILSDWPALRAFVDAVGAIAPVVHNFDRIAPNPEALSLYFAIATLLIVPKAMCFYAWLNSDRVGAYRHFIISPQTATSPKHGSEFVTEPFHAGEVREEKPRSMASRIAWSLAILLMCASFVVVYALMFGWEAGPRYSRPKDVAELARIAASPLALWIQCSVKQTLFAGFLSAIAVSIIRDYSVFLRRLADSRKESRQ